MRCFTKELHNTCTSSYFVVRLFPNSPRPRCCGVCCVLTVRKTFLKVLLQLYHEPANVKLTLFSQTTLVWAIFWDFFDTKCQQNCISVTKMWSFRIPVRECWLQIPADLFSGAKRFVRAQTFFRLFKNFIPCSPHLLSYFLTFQDVLCKSCQKVRKSYPVCVK